MNIFLAPMDGITDCAYRIIVKEIFEKYNSDDNLWMVTEFMSSDGFIANPTWVLKHLMKTEIENSVIAQIFWTDKNNLINTAINIDKNYDFRWVELNTWCPAPKITRTWAWSGMLKDKENTLDIIKSLREHIKWKLSIKTRCWLLENDKQNQMEFLIKVSDLCDMITVHWRTFNKWHCWDVDWQFIYELKKFANPRCNIIWNWWIKSYQQSKQLLWNLDWVMIWQSAIWNPYIFTNHSPTDQWIKQTIIRHLNILTATEVYYKKNPFTKENIFIQPKIAELEEIISWFTQQNTISMKSTIEFRKHLFSYIKGIPWSKHFKQDVIFIRNYWELKEHIEKFL